MLHGFSKFVLSVCLIQCLCCVQFPGIVFILLSDFILHLQLWLGPGGSTQTQGWCSAQCIVHGASAVPCNIAVLCSNVLPQGTAKLSPSPALQAGVAGAVTDGAKVDQEEQK